MFLEKRQWTTDNRPQTIDRHGQQTKDNGPQTTNKRTTDNGPQTI
ncbi:MAG: hypothetical protein ABJB16_04665 [Saprospiraceae bacterium]